MTPEAIADRLVNYADAIAAFSVVNSLAFLVTLGDPEIRCSIANALWLVVAVLALANPGCRAMPA